MLLPPLQEVVNSLDLNAVAAERKEVLQPLISYIQEKYDQGEPVNLNFICTHNSRRSQLSQVWAQTAADLYEINANCYSGGVEVTAFNERAVASLKRSGFRVTQKGEVNPKYFIFHSDDADPITAFSKIYDDNANPTSGFAAVMTCSHADENCPFIGGADVRLPVRYEDPKAFDDTPEEAAKYDERSMQIATEMCYIFSQIKK